MNTTTAALTAISANAGKTRDFAHDVYAAAYTAVQDAKARGKSQQYADRLADAVFDAGDAMAALLIASA